MRELKEISNAELARRHDLCERFAVICQQLREVCDELDGQEAWGKADDELGQRVRKLATELTLIRIASGWHHLTIHAEEWHRDTEAAMAAGRRDA